MVFYVSRNRVSRVDFCHGERRSYSDYRGKPPLSKDKMIEETLGNLRREAANSVLYELYHGARLPSGRAKVLREDGIKVLPRPEGDFNDNYSTERTGRIKAEKGGIAKSGARRMIEEGRLEALVKFIRTIKCNEEIKSCFGEKGHNAGMLAAYNFLAYIFTNDEEIKGRIDLEIIRLKALGRAA